ncbi:MAG: hypothetical protein GY847_28435 [Proteobacteria bacterium]|nr:hypothetical protein [Pseudomonadota bacterium]
MTKKEWNPGIAVFLSLLFPGVGQIYKRQVLGGLGWMLLIGAAYGFSGVLFMGAVLLGAGLESFLLLGTGAALHVICVIWAAVGDPQKTSGAPVMFLTLFIAGIGLYVYKYNFPKEEVVSLPSTDCGHPAHKPVSVQSITQWQKYKCLSKYSAGSRWDSCLRRPDYSPFRGDGCPGEQRCCPPSK